eukprot:7637895-Pyramimonas_sp.AAC.1
MSSLQGVSRQVSTSENELSKIKNQMDLAQLRCDQLTVRCTRWATTFTRAWCRLRQNIRPLSRPEENRWTASRLRLASD